MCDLTTLPHPIQHILIAASLKAAFNSVSVHAQTRNVACLNDYRVSIGGPKYPAVDTPCDPAAAVIRGTEALGLLETAPDDRLRLEPRSGVRRPGAPAGSTTSATAAATASGAG